MNLKSNAPYVLLAILLLSIITLSFSIIYYPSAFPTLADGGNDRLSGNEPGDNDGDTPGNGNPVPEEYHTVYPKLPLASEEYLFTQKLNGEGNITVKEVIQTPSGYYIITETDCLFGDVTSKIKSVAVFHSDPTGTVTKALVLNSRLPMTFLAAKVGAKALTVLTKTAESSYLFSVEYDLSDFSNIPLPKADAGRLFTFNDEIITLLEGSQTTVYLSNSVGYLPAGEVKAIYGFGDYLSIFMNTDGGYCILKLNNKLQDTDRITVNSAAIIDIVPVVEGGKQKYIVIEKGVATKIYKYDSTFRKDTAQSVSLGTVDKVKIVPVAGGFMLVLTGSARGINMLNSNLEITLSNTQVFSGISDILDSTEYSKGYCFLAKSDAKLCLIDYRNDNTFSIKNISENADNGFLRLNLNNTLNIFYTVTSGYASVEIAGTALTA